MVSAGSVLQELESWERIPSVDEIAELMAPMVADDRVSALHVGFSQDGTPIIAYGPPASSGDDGRDAVLMLGGSTGNSTMTVALVTQIFVSSLVQQATPMDLWILPAVSPAQLRLSDATLGQLRPSVAEYVGAVRGTYAPWEDPELSSPIDADPLLQPDRADVARPDRWPEEWIASSREASALARAVSHLRPKVLLSVREVPAGGVTVAVSHDLSDELSQRIVGAATAHGTIAPQRTAKLRKGRWHETLDGLVTVEDHHQCVARLERSSEGSSDHRVFVGGAAIWVLLESVSPDSTYVALDLPRLSAKAFHDTSESDQTRTTETLMEHRGAERVPYLVKRFCQPDHPVHEMEISAQRQPTSPVDEPVMADELASVGWLGAEALAQRQSVLLTAIEAFEDRLAHLSSGQHERALQIMRQERSGFDARLRPLLSNRRYSVPATNADVAWWERGYRLQTALILSEALNVLRDEHNENREIQALRRELQGLIEQEMRPSRQTFRAVSPTTLMRAALEVLDVVTVSYINGELPLARATRRRDRLVKRREHINRRARELRNLKRPRAERREMEDLRDELDEQIKVVESLIDRYRAQNVRGAVSSDPERSIVEATTSDPDPSLTDIPVADAVNQEPPPSSHQVEEHEETNDQEVEMSTSSDPERVLSTLKEDAADVTESVPRSTPDEFPDPLSDRRDSVVEVPTTEDRRSNDVEQGQNGGHASTQEIATVGSKDLVAVDDRPGTAVERSDAFEASLPRNMRMTPEWPDIGPVEWETQLPRDRTPVLAAVLADRPSGEQIGIPVSEAIVVDQVTETGVEHAQPVEAIGEHRVVHGDGFIRRRVELDGVFSEQLVRLAVPQPTGGRFQRLLRRRLHRYP